MSTLHIYNSLTRKKAPFVPQDPAQVRLYVCGMTVYDYCHLGHARMLVSFDVVQRWLRMLGYGVKYVRNITDIDDKIIRRAVQSNRTLSEVTQFYIQAMHADEQALGVQPPTFEPRATEHVKRMLDIIGMLEKKELAYRAADGDVNYAVRRFEGYGKLSGKALDDLRAGERVAVDSSKHDPLDFVLWKAAKPDEPQDSKWQSPYGWGRPGWHIECSAMSEALLGLPLDIHGGGPDLKFPHHENEIAQSEGAFACTLANVWMHCGPLMVDAEKMSKSLGNFRTIRETISGTSSDASSNSAQPGQADYTPNLREAEMLRFFIVRNHYRSPQNYTPDNLRDAQQALDRLYQALLIVPPTTEADAPDSNNFGWTHPAAQAFRQAMNDDFNTAGAIAALFDLASDVQRSHSPQQAALLRRLAGVLGLLQKDPQTYMQTPTRYLGHAHHAALDAERIKALLVERKQAKASRDFARADAIRASLREAGVELEDRPDGHTHWRRI